MKKVILILSTLLATLYISGQITISGVILDEYGSPLFGATCYLKSDKSIASVSDFEGYWSLEILDVDATELIEVRYLGYASQQISVSTFGNEPLTIAMSADNNIISEVVIKGQNPVSEDFSVEQIDRLDVYFSPLAKADPLNAIQALPASTNTDESANPSLRGSNADRTIVVIDGVPIRNPVKFTQLNGTGNFSIFNTEFLENQTVYASNPPLTYANSTAGLVELNLRKEAPENELMIGASLAQVSAMWNNSHKDEKGFMTIYANQAFSDLFLAANSGQLNGLRSFNTTDAGIRLYRELSDNMTLSLYNYSAIESYDVDVSILGSEERALGSQKRNFSVASLRWGDLINQWSVHSGFDISGSDFQFGSIESDNYRRELYNSINYKRVGEVFTLQTGINYIWVKDEFDEVLPVNFYDNRVESVTYTQEVQLGHSDVQMYFYGKVSLDKLTLSGALRKNIPLDGQESFFSKQFSAKYTPIESHSILLALGNYHGYNFPTSNNLNLDLYRSKQMSLEYFYTGDVWDLSAAVYAKEEDNPLSFTQQFLIQGETTRSIKGLELALTKHIGDRLKVELSNTFLDVNIETEESTIRGEKDLNYFVKLGVTYFNNDVFNLGLSYITRPGNYYTDIVGSTTWDQVTYPVFESVVNGSQLGGYHNVSLTFNRQIDLPNDKGLVLYGVINNVLDTENQNYALYDESFGNVGFEHYSRRWFYVGGMFLF